MRLLRIDRSGEGQYGGPYYQIQKTHGWRAFFDSLPDKSYDENGEPSKLVTDFVKDLENMLAYIRRLK